MRRRVVVLAVVGALLGAAGCGGGSSNRTTCVAGVCQVRLTGEQQVDIEIGAFERDLRVGPIEPDAVTLSALGDQARLGPGGSAQLGGLQVLVTSVSGQQVELRVSRA